MVVNCMPKSEKPSVSMPNFHSCHFGKCSIVPVFFLFVDVGPESWVTCLVRGKNWNFKANVSEKLNKYNIFMKSTRLGHFLEQHEREWLHSLMQNSLYQFLLCPHHTQRHGYWVIDSHEEREKNLDSSHYYRIRSATAFIQAIMRAQRHINFFVMTATWHSDWERFGKRLIESADFWQHQTEAREKNALLYSIVNGTLNRFTTKYFAALCKIALFEMRAEDFIQWVQSWQPKNAAI